MWVVDNYYAYSTVIGVVSIYGIILTVVETRANLIRLRDMAHYEDTVNVFRGPIDDPLSKKFEVSTTELVPGDIFEV